MTTPLLEVRDIRKTYPPRLMALRGVTISVHSGKVVALLGANGAGKSTLARILTGVDRPTAGTIWIDGVQRDLDTPATATGFGIAAVHQELPLLPNLTAAENVALGQSGQPFLSVFRRRRAMRTYEAIAGSIPDCPKPGALVAGLTVGDRQKVALVRALSADPRLLIVDEGTSSVSSDERRELWALMRRLAAERELAVVYITHFLDDVFGASDKVVILRDGSVALEADTAALSQDEIVTVLSGSMAPSSAIAQNGTAPVRTRSAESPQVGLRVRDLVTPRLSPISLNVERGECVGLYGAPGCGASEVLRAIAGLDRHSGSVTWDGRSLPARAHIRARANIAYCTGDRAQMLMRPWSVQANVGLPHLFRSSLARFPKRRADRDRTERLIAHFGIVGAATDAISTLSGGNQQRVAVARTLTLGQPLLLLGDDLSRGVDIVGRAELAKMLHQAAVDGASLLLYSSDPTELIALCQRVIVLAEGEITDVLQGDQLQLLSLEAGGRRRAAAQTRETNR